MLNEEHKDYSDLIINLSEKVKDSIVNESIKDIQIIHNARIILLEDLLDRVKSLK